MLEFADEHEKAKTSTPLMFLKGFGYDQCEKDATEGSNPMRRGCCEATIRGFELDDCEKDATEGSNPMRSGCCEATIQIVI
jgi:hypothetical protein